MLGPLAVDTDEGFHHALLQQYAALVLQRWARGWLARRELRAQVSPSAGLAAGVAWITHCTQQPASPSPHPHLLQWQAAARIQRSWRATWPALRSRVAAARQIQRAWRVHRCRRLFHHLRLFIHTAEARDPRRTLAVLAQWAEADMADAAAGVRVRMRLDGGGGAPALVYSITTRRPIAQLVAPAPGGDVGPSSCSSPLPGKCPPCCQRQWRPVPAELWRKPAGLLRLTAQMRRVPASRAAVPPGVQPGGQCSRRHARRERLLQIYTEGRQQEDEESAAASADSSIADALGSSDEDEELLLHWSEALAVDFEAYLEHWLKLGGTAWTNQDSTAAQGVGSPCTHRPSM